jgi:signal transduction histidine kinase
LITPDSTSAPEPVAGVRQEWQAAFARGSEVEFRELLENLPVGAYTCDVDGLITYYNRRAVDVWGREPAGNEPPPRCCGTFLMFNADGIAIEDATCWMRRAIREDRPFLGEEIHIERPDGTLTAVLGYARPIHDEAGGVVGAVSMMVDITQQKHVEQQLRRADRAKDQFLAMLAHELRNPLAPMHNALQIMRLAADDSSALEQARGTIERQLQHLTRVVDDMIDVSRMTRNTLTLRRERVDLGTVVRQALETCEPLFDAMQHEVEVTLAPELLQVHGDPMRLSQVLTSLLSNAAKYTRPSGHIWIRVERQGSDALISVRDSGIGIATQDLSSIFDLFTSADGVPQAPQPGLGIGLTLARGLAELHGGSIRASSDGPDKGSEFQVRLPLILDFEPESADEPALPLRPQSAVAARTILVVDDNVDAAESLAELLQLLGHVTHTANEGAGALAMAAELRPEVILLDIGLPGMSGHDVARAIRDESWGAGVTLIALTGWGQSEDRDRSKDAGFDHHLVKPVDLEQLESLIARVPAAH